MKKRCILLVCIFMLVIVMASGCSKSNNSVKENVFVEKVNKSVEAQIELILDNKDVWSFTEDEISFGSDGYAVTDLDHNGRVEIIASSLQGTGLYTYSKYYEVNDTFDGLNEIARNLEEGDSEADIMVSNVRQYYDASTDTYYYIFEDIVRNGMWGSATSKRSIFLVDGNLNEEYIASTESMLNEEDDEYISTYYDANNKPISENEYENMDKEIYKDLKYDLISLDWIMLNDDPNVTYDRLLDSYNGFGNVLDEEALARETREEAYADAITGIKEYHIFPDGTMLESGDIELISKNSYAICDIDDDGKDELIISWSDSSASAGMHETVYEYNSKKYEYEEELKEFPMITYYDNGIVKAGLSHNQGKAGDDFWPFILYKYNKEKDIYEEIAMVDAWSRALTEVDEHGNSFPEEVDKNNDGIVFYIMKKEDGYAEKFDSLVSKEEYEKWLNSYIEGSKEIKVEYQSM